MNTRTFEKFTRAYASEFIILSLYTFARKNTKFEEKKK